MGPLRHVPPPGAGQGGGGQVSLCAGPLSGDRRRGAAHGRRSAGRGPAFPAPRLVRHGPQPAGRTHRRRPHDPGRQGARIPRPQPHGEPLQRRHDLVAPPFGRRLPRREARTLPGPHRPLPRSRTRRGARHARHPLPDRAAGRRRHRGRAARDGQRRGVVRSGGRGR